LLNLLANSKRTFTMRAALVYALIFANLLPANGFAAPPLDPPVLPPLSDETDARLPQAMDSSYDFAAGDVDEDGDPDLFVANGGQSRLLVNDAGFFADETATRLPTLADTTLVADFGDVDGDGDLDLALANTSGVNRLLVNDGSGRFADESTSRLPAYLQVSMSLKLGDLDGDHDLDMVVANRAAQNRILINNGSGVFADETGTRFAPGSDLTYEIELVDVDGDGALDLFVANQRSPDRLFLNDGLGFFADVTFRLPSPAAASSTIDAAPVDVDGDGDRDLVLAESEQGLRLFRNDGTGVFADVTGAQLPPLGQFAIKARSGDVDFDGDADLFVATAGQDQLLLNDGAGVFAFAAPGTLPLDPHRSFGLAVLDSDADLDLDVLFATPRDQNHLLVNTIPYPRILLTKTPAVIEVGDTATFRVTAFDEDGFASATLAITDPNNGTETLDLLPDLSSGNALRTFTTSVIGAHRATVTAVDVLGNTGTRSLDFDVLARDVTGPAVSVAVEAPSPLLVGHAVTIRVTVTDDRGVVSKSLTVNGTPVPLNNQGVATYVTAAPGGHSAVATATDAAGNVGTGSALFTVGVDVLPPVVSVTATPNPVALAHPVSITVTATDNVAVVTRSLIVRGPGITGDQPLPLNAAGQATFTPFQPGTFTLVASASDASGLIGTASTTFEAEGVPDNTPPQLSLNIVPQTVALGGTVTLTVVATDDVAVVEATLEINGTPVSLDAGGSFVFTPPVLGLYTAVATASDGTGNDSSVTKTFRAVDPDADNDPPTVSITTPATDSELTAPVEIVGTASDDTLVSYKLEYSPREENTFTIFAEGSSDVVNGALGTFDTTVLLNDLYDIRLTAIDINGVSSSVQVVYGVAENLKVGNFSVTFQDLAIPVAGIPIVINRTYDSRNKKKGDFGIGWSLDLQSTKIKENRILGDAWAKTFAGGPIPIECVDPVGEHYVTITLPDGRKEEFDVAVSPRCQLFFQVATVIFVPRAGTASTLQPLDGADVFYNAGNLLDFNGLDLYDPTQYRLTTADGRAFELDQNFGIRKVTDANGNTVTFTSGGVVHSAGKSLTFTRDSNGRISKITDPNGNDLLYEYDARGDLVAFSNAENETTDFVYNSSHGLTEIRDPRGITPVKNTYDDHGRLIAHTDANGKTIEYTHDLEGRQEIVKDRLGNLTVYLYDDRGNVIEEIDPAGNVVRRTFDSRNNRTSETVPHAPGTLDPPKSLFTYDARDNLLTSKDPEGNLTTVTYNSRNQVLTTLDPRGNLTTNVYDANGNLLEVRDALGGVQKYTYDARGNLMSQLDSEGGLTQYQYDGVGNRIRETGALGDVALFTYNANGNRLTETRSRTVQGSSETLVTTFTYDKVGRPLTTRYPDGTETATSYDALGKKESSRDELGRVTGFEYDEMGRLEKTTYPDGTFEASTYDAEGRRLTSTDRGGHVTRFDYDEAGRVTRTTYEDDTFTIREYDAAGRVVARTDAVGNRTRFEYDAAGQRTKIVNPLDQETLFTYDANGNQLSITDPRGKTTEFSYDALNRRTATVFHDGTSQLVQYDSLGRRISETDQADKTTQFQYDKLGRLTKIVDALLQETSYVYDEVANRVSQTDANGHTTTFEYDRRGRQTGRTLPGGARETMDYDEVGNLLNRTAFNGALTTFTYDAANRLLSRSYPDSTEVAFTYTDTGRRATTTDERGDITTYTYDSRDRLETLTYADGRQLAYGYDGHGNRTSMAASIGGSTPTATFAYDPLNRLETVTDPQGRSYVHEYDESGNRAALSYPNGVASSYGYDDLNRLTNLTTTHTSAGAIQSYAFILGAAGSRLRIDEMGGTVRTYSYDALYRLTAESVSNGGGSVYQKAFTYDAVGNRLSQITTGAGAASVAYAYDPRDRLVDEGGRAYVWDASGNLITKTGDAAYSWDFENRLIGIVKADGTLIEYTYDPDGNRLSSRTTPPAAPVQVANFLVDSSVSLSEVVAESDQAGNLSAYYVRGDDLLAVMRPAGPNTWSTRYYHADGTGSIRKLTGDSGNVTDSYSYTAFGELVAHIGTDPQPYAFTGEPLDPNSGFQYHRARWLSPALAIFTAMDLVYGNAEDPRSLHRYAYALGDPVNRTDPSGLLSNFVYGQRVHQIIGVDFIAGDPSMRDADIGISTILDDVIPIFGRLRPDLIDFRFKQIYEIKTVRQFAEGLWQLQGYLLMLNWADPDKTHPWTAGIGYIPPKAFPVGPLATAVTFPPLGGVITYEVFDALPIVLALAAVAIKSTAAMMAQVGQQVGLAITINTMAPVG
jgi:RHS repeat-associated protein